MVAASDVIMLLLLPWKPYKLQVVSINWKYKNLLGLRIFITFRTSLLDPLFFYIFSFLDNSLMLII